MRSINNSTFVVKRFDKFIDFVSIHRLWVMEYVWNFVDHERDEIFEQTDVMDALKHPLIQTGLLIHGFPRKTREMNTPY